MNKETKKMVMGFVEYLQSIYGIENGDSGYVTPVPPNSLAIPLFLTQNQDDIGNAFGFVGDAITGGNRYANASEVDILSSFNSIASTAGIAPIGGAGVGIDPMQQMMAMGM